jgi:hypothetical protein
MFGCTAKTESKPTATLVPAQTRPPDPASSLTPTAAAILETVEGSFRNQIGILEKNMPRADSEKYVGPTASEQAAFANLVSLIYAEDLAQATTLAGDLHYRLNYYVDRGDEYAMSYLLRESRPIEKGWGLYVLRMKSASNIIVEAPHPLSDRRSPSVALDIYRALDAGALLIAGAHRNANGDGSADVAHAPESIFQSVHVALSQDIQAKAGEVIILQIHGFHTSKHEGYPQVVFGLGNNPQRNEVALAERIRTALSEQGISTGICTSVESDLQDLCAKTNIQGSTTKAGMFLHIELDETIRGHDEALIAALVQVFGQ